MAGPVKVQIRGIAKLAKKLDKLDSETRKKGKTELNRWAFKIHKEMIDSIRTPSGQYRRYTGGRGGKDHWSSLPGKPPNSDSRNLESSTNLDLAKESNLVAVIKSAVEYAASLEYGTRKMEARPFMRPAYDKYKKDVIDGLAGILEGLD